MDNITHTLIGIMAADAVALQRKQDKRPIWIASILANNFPDLDVLLTSSIFRGKIGYLLHHRGHTHTLLMAPLQSLLILGFLAFFWRKQSIPWKEVIFVSFLGPFLHIFADSWNSYGVHPFWPWNSQWYYGDSVFILEPLLWALFLPYVFFRLQSKTLRLLALLPLFGVLIASWLHSAVPKEIAVFFTLITPSTLVFLALPKTKKLWATIGLACLLLLGFRYTHNRTLNLMNENAKDKILAPAPANPFCWDGIEIITKNNLYEANLLLLAPYPSIFPVSKCKTLRAEKITAPISLERRDLSTASRKELGTFRSSLLELQQIAATCEGNALLRFFRAPFWKKTARGWIFGDLRFDRDEHWSFGVTEIEEGSSNCFSVATLPPWAGPFHPDNFSFGTAHKSE